MRETITAVNFNDGNYVPQVVHVNLYDDAAHTILSDSLTITIPTQNPPRDHPLEFQRPSAIQSAGHFRD